MNSRPITLLEAHSKEWLPVVRELFREYAGSLDFDLCFQNFENELATLPGDYAPSAGALVLARMGDSNCGCVALRPFAENVCEMKRLYVRPAFRGHGVGKALVREIIERARGRYRTMRLDTVPSMISAIGLYESFGFKKIAPYRPNPIPGAVYMELSLQGCTGD